MMSLIEYLYIFNFLMPKTGYNLVLVFHMIRRVVLTNKILFKLFKKLKNKDLVTHFVRIFLEKIGMFNFSC